MKAKMIWIFMITEEKIKEERKKVSNGEPRGEVAERLKKEGYSEEDIKMVFAAHRYDMRPWYLSFAIIFLLLGLYLFIVRNSYLMLLFSTLMFYVYYKEIERLKNEQNKNSTNL